MVEPHKNLNARFLAALANADADAMAMLYEQAATVHEAKGDEASAAFYYTQAYIFALDAGSPCANRLERWLRKHNRH